MQLLLHCCTADFRSADSSVGIAALAGSRRSSDERTVVAGSCPRSVQAEGPLIGALPMLQTRAPSIPIGSIARVQPTRMKDRDASAAIVREPPLTAPFVATPGDRSALHQQPRSFDRRCR
jgi:hypothetical protein